MVRLEMGLVWPTPTLVEVNKEEKGHPVEEVAGQGGGQSAGHVGCQAGQVAAIGEGAIFDRKPIPVAEQVE